MKRSVKVIKEELKKHGIHNAYNLLPKGSFLLYWRKSEKMYPGGWFLVKIGYVFKGAHYLDNGALHITWGKKGEVEEAIREAAAKIGQKDWVLTPYGEYAEKSVLEEAMKVLEVEK